jgi:sugar O-acyltransferase (sialic acid O-acetyltransferase NeuD family)
MYLYGASGHAKVILEILEASAVSVYGLFDDNVNIKQIWEYPVSPFPGNYKQDTDEVIISIGSNKIRQKLALSLPCKFGTAVHPQATISKRAVIGEGTVIMAGVTVNADVKIGQHCIVNTNASVDHDCMLGDYVHISPNVALCGAVQVGEGTHIGAGTVVIPGVKIGSWAVIGAGSVVVRDVEDGAVVMGNPAKSNVKSNR